MPNKATHQIDKFDGVGIGLGFSALVTTEDLNENGAPFMLDLNAGLIQVLQEGTNSYVYGNERIAQYDGTNPAYFLGDALGSVRKLADSNGVITLAKNYQPYGEVMSNVGVGASNYAFTGEWADSSVKLLYLRSRYYSGYLNQYEATSIAVEGSTWVTVKCQENR